MKFVETLKNYVRILRISKKPDREDFIEIMRICGIGIGLVGLLGFSFYFVSVILGG